VRVSFFFILKQKISSFCLKMSESGGLTVKKLTKFQKMQKM